MCTDIHTLLPDPCHPYPRYPRYAARSPLTSPHPRATPTAQNNLKFTTPQTRIPRKSHQTHPHTHIPQSPCPPNSPPTAVRLPPNPPPIRITITYTHIHTHNIYTQTRLTPPPTVYVKARHLGYQRGKRNTNPNVSLLSLEGVDSTEAAEFYLGKRVAFVYRAQTETRGSKHRVVWGKIRKTHGELHSGGLKGWRREERG